MNYLRRIFVLLFVFVSVSALWSRHANVIWNTPSRNSSESMPCGGGDIGMNIWVEEGDILFYLSRSGAFDENNCQLKQGRFRIRLFPNPFKDAKDFRQELKLKDGYVEVSAGGTQIQFWADVYHPVVHVEITNAQPLRTEVSYENWRYKERMIRKGEGQQCSYKWAPPKGAVTTADFVSLSSKRELPGMTKERNLLLFYHRNPEQTVFDIAVAQQGMENVKSQMMNPLKHLTFGGYFFGDNLEYTGTTDSIYAGTDYRAWNFRSSKASRKEQFCIVLHTEQTAIVEQWEQDLQINLQRIAPQGKISSKIVSQDKKQTRLWWNTFWQRSFIEPIGNTENKNDNDIKKITRNYTLFRYMLGCNAYGSVPTKFNGGLFTFDPCHIDEKQAFTPDYRKWGGGTMTAQNQRLVY